MNCCGPRQKAPICDWCGALLDVHRARVVLWRGAPLRFCNRECQARWADEWREAS